MLTVEFIEKINRSRVLLSRCITANDVEESFKQLEITDYPSKIALLRQYMQIEKFIFSAKNREKDRYKEYLNFFLDGAWKDTNHAEEPEKLFPDFSNKAVKNQTEKTNEKSDIKDLCEALKISEDDYNLFKDIYESKILTRIKTKYFSQLVAVIEDLVNEKNIGKFRSRNMERFKIVIDEYYKETKENKPKLYLRTSCLIYPRSAVILYDPRNNVETIYASIAHELGFILAHFGFFPDKSNEKFSNLFAFLAINSEKELHNGEYSFLDRAKTEIIENIKALSTR